MKTWLKTSLIALAIIALIGAGWLIGRGGGGIEKSVSFSLTVNASGDFEVTITPADQTCTKGQTVTYDIAVVPSGGFDAPVNLTVSGLPAGSYTLTRNPVEMGAWTSQLTVNTTLLQSNSTYACNITAIDE